MSIIGHQKILEFLAKSLKTNKISHAYLFVGPEHLGKKKVVLEFIKLLQCGKAQKVASPFSACNQCRSCQEIDSNSHPDVLFIEPEIIEKKGSKKEQEISIEKIRQIQHQLSLFPYRGPYKIVLIDRADKMTKEAANALLKTLEEPTKKTVLILISSAPQFLLPTVISRCLLIKFLPVPKSVITSQLSLISNQPPALLDKIVRLSGNRPGLVIDYLTNPDLLKKQNQILEDLFNLFKKDLNFRFQYAEILSKDINLAHQTLNQWLIFFRDLMLNQVGCQNLTIWSPAFRQDTTLKHRTPFQLKNILEKIIKTNQILNNPSFNSRLALEVLMLEFV